MQRVISSGWFLTCITACAVAGCGAPPPANQTEKALHAIGASAPKTAAERGFTGVFMPTGTLENPAGIAQWPNTPWPKAPPFTPAGAAESQRLNDHGNFTACSPSGPVFHMWEVGLFPIQLLEAPGQLVIQREASGLVRRVYLDGRGHPPDDEILATWNGHSVGTNGRARAANGVGSNAKPSSLDSDPRFPLSDALHLVERFKLVANGELLEDEITIEDATYYTDKVVMKHYFQRRPDIDMLEYFCGDNPRRD